MELEKLRIEVKFEYQIEIDEEVESEYVLIPSMIIQPFVENSIWHGIANLEKQGIIVISFLLQDEKSLQITIEDTGTGIAAEDLPYIFNRFYKSDKSRTREGGGAGLGLAIAKWIVEQHRGDIKVESTVGKGTKITISLPA